MSKPVLRFYTSASLMSKQLVFVAKEGEENNIKIEDIDASVLQRNRGVTAKRELTEIKMRLSTLIEEELYLLINANNTTQQQICYLAFARTYYYFRSFVEQIILEKAKIFDFVLTEMDYNVFASQMAIEHEEFDRLADSTKSKLRQVTFKVLEQAGIIDSVKNKRIQRQLLEPALEELLKDNSEDLKLFLVI